MTIKEAFISSKEHLSSVYPIDEATAIISLLFEERFKIDRKALLMTSNAPFDFEHDLDKYMIRLMQREPVQHILGFAYFGHIRVLVDSNVLIPRPETEELLYWIKSEHSNPKTIVDVCTGSGCIAMYLKQLYQNAEIIATDVSTDALELAKRSEKLNFEESTIQFLKHDILKDQWFSSWPDIVVCNPPYIVVEEAKEMDKNVLEYEPHLALFVYDSDPLLFYKRVIEVFEKEKFPEIYFELNPLTSETLRQYCISKDLKIEFRKDMQGKIRCARITR